MFKQDNAWKDRSSAINSYIRASRSKGGDELVDISEDFDSFSFFCLCFFFVLFCFDFILSKEKHTLSCFLKKVMFNSVPFLYYFMFSILF